MRIFPLRRLALLAGLAAGFPVMASTAVPSPPPDKAQAAATTLVTVDFRALARDGIPVLDLKPEEVVLKVGGRAREIVAFELVKAGSGSPPAGAAAAPLPPFITNAPHVGGRSVVLLVDEDAIPPGHEAPVKDALSQLVGALTPEDQVGVATVRGGVVAHPSVRHDRVLADVAGFRGLATASSFGQVQVARGGVTGGTDTTCRTRMVHDALMNQFESVVPSVPTIVVLVSNGLAGPSTTSLSAIGNVSAAGSASASACEFTSGDLEALTKAAAVSRAHVYAIEAFRDSAAGDGFENFAHLTGNALIRLAGDTRPAMKRIANETSAYYVAAFEVTDQERTGSSQRVDVTVTRQGVDVKAQPVVVVAKPAAANAKSSKPKLRDMLVAQRVLRDLPLRATVHLSRASQDGKLRVVCVFDSSDPAAKFAEASVILFDTTGKARAQWTGQAADFKSSPVMAAFAAPGPGAYRMRLAAIDTSGAAGTIDEDVRVEAASQGTAQASALMLGTKGGAGFAPRLQFIDEQVAMAMVEVFGAPKTAEVAVKFEFAATEDGPAQASLPGAIQSPRDDLRMAYVSVPIAQMPPGDVVIRAVISVDGQPLAAKPVHTLRKVAR